MDSIAAGIQPVEDDGRAFAPVGSDKTGGGLAKRTGFLLVYFFIWRATFPSLAKSQIFFWLDVGLKPGTGKLIRILALKPITALEKQNGNTGFK